MSDLFDKQIKIGRFMRKDKELEDAINRLFVENPDLCKVEFVSEGKDDYGIQPFITMCKSKERINTPWYWLKG